MERFAEDSSGYPDCRPEYYRAFQELVRAGTRPGNKNRDYYSGHHNEEERDHPARGRARGTAAFDVVVLSERRCSLGACDSCLLRLRAFAEAGVTDPISYRRTVAAKS